MRIVIATACASVMAVCIALEGAEPAKTAPLGSPEFRPSPGRPIGWRGDWTGRYPDATPVTTWSYAPKSPVTGLRYQAAKPKEGDDGSGAKEVWGGDVAAWLVLGAFNAKDAKTALDEAFVPDESALSPAEGEKAGDLAWRPEGQPDYRDAFTPENIHKNRYGPYSLGGSAVRFYTLSGKGANTVSYAHAYLYARSAGKVCVVVSHEDGMKVWVNGKEVYRSDRAFRNWYFYEVDLSIRDLTVPVPCPRFEAELRKGWNRLLVKVSRKQDSASFTVRIAAPADAAYESTNIRWVTPMPSWSWSTPIVVGDRVFVTSEPDELICVDKNDGRILWRRTNTPYDATTEEERAANPVFKEIEPIARELAKGVDTDRNTVLRRQMTDLLRKIDRDKYTWTGDWGHISAIGFACPTPVSDGESVYAFFAPGVVVCYDLEGRRQWIRSVMDLGVAPDRKGKPHTPTPNCASPVLVGDKFILFKGWFRAFDRKTGNVLWDTGNITKDFDGSHGGIPRYYSSSSVVPFRLEGQDFVMAFWGRILRASDGKVMSDPVLNENTYNTPVIEDDVAYVWGGQKYKMTLVDDQVQMRGMGGIQGPHQFTVSSPLLHDGLIYAMDSHGELNVTDSRTLKTVYRQRLDMWPLYHFNAIGATPSVALGGRHIYLMDNQGTTVVIEPGRTFKPVAYNHLRASMQHPWPLTTLERTESTPVFDGGRIYIRGEANLYCIGEK